LRGSLAETAGLEVAQKPLAQVGGEALQLAADGGFVDLEETGDLEQRPPVEEVGGEQEPVLGGKGFEGAGDGMGEPVELGWRGRLDGCRRSGGAGVGAGVERGFAAGAAMVVHVALSECCTQPAEEGAAAGVGGEWGVAPAAAFAEAEQLSVERIGEVVAQRGGAGDGDGGLGEGSAIEAQKALPGSFATEGAGLGEGEFGQVQRMVERGLLRGGGTNLRRQAVVVFGADGRKRGAELLASEAAGFGVGGDPQLLNEGERETG